MLGHNGGPPLETPSSWNGFCWRKAVKKAGKPPSREIVEIRTRRAAALGLDYQTYASVLADCGTTPATLVFAITRDWVAHEPFGPRITSAGIFEISKPASDKLAGLSVPSVALVALRPAGGPAGQAVSAALSATAGAGGWRLDVHGIAPEGGAGAIADWLVRLLTQAGLSPRSALLIGSPDLHQEIATRARMTGLVSAARYFG